MDLHNRTIKMPVQMLAIGAFEIRKLDIHYGHKLKKVQKTFKVYNRSKLSNIRLDKAQDLDNVIFYWQKGDDKDPFFKTDMIIDGQWCECEGLGESPRDSIDCLFALFDYVVETSSGKSIRVL